MANVGNVFIQRLQTFFILDVFYVFLNVFFFNFHLSVYYIYDSWYYYVEGTSGVVIIND